MNQLSNLSEVMEAANHSKNSAMEVENHVKKQCEFIIDKCLNNFK